MRKHALSALYWNWSQASKYSASEGCRALSCTSGRQTGRAHGTSHPALLAAAGLLTAASIAALDEYRPGCLRSCCAAELPLPNANPKADQFVADFKSWLKNVGGDTSALDIRPSVQVCIVLSMN